MNPSKKDVKDVYVTYCRLKRAGRAAIKFQPVNLQTEVLFGESYAILEEDNIYDENTTIDLEVLYITEEGLILKKFRRKETDILPPTHSHPLFQSSINLIKETTKETINIDAIIQVITNDIYSVKAPIHDESYRDLIKKSKLFKSFFEDLYKEMDEIYYDEVKYHSLKLDFSTFLQKEFGLSLELAEESDNIIISNCLAIMRKLNLTQQEMAEYFCKHFFY